MSERVLANRLKDIRSEKGLTQADLAAKVGVSRKTINTVENLVFVPSTTLALALAETLGMSVEDIFYLEPERKRQRTKDNWIA